MRPPTILHFCLAMSAPFAFAQTNSDPRAFEFTYSVVTSSTDVQELVRGIQTGVTRVSTRVFIPIYLADSLNVPTGHGFYVHREEHYSRNNVEEAGRLSRESWRTFEPFWGTKVIGLFREGPGPSGMANLNRIVWYPSFRVWSDTRNFQKEPESAKRFEARDKLKVDGVGVAIPTDRVVR